MVKIPVTDTYRQCSTASRHTGAYVQYIVLNNPRFWHLTLSVSSIGGSWTSRTSRTCWRNRNRDPWAKGQILNVIIKVIYTITSKPLDMLEVMYRLVSSRLIYVAPVVSVVTSTGLITELVVAETNFQDILCTKQSSIYSRCLKIYTVYNSMIRSAHPITFKLFHI